MKCKACGKSMDVATNIAESLSLMPGAPPEQLTMCNACEQPYMYTFKNGKLKMAMINERWLKVHKKDRADVEQSIEIMHDLKKQMKLVEKWKGYFK